MKILKRVFLFIFIFLSILFIKNTCFGVTITYNNWEGVPQYATIPALQLSTGTNSYITLINNDRSKAIVLEPYNSTDYIALSRTTFYSYNPTSNSLTDIYIHTCSFDTATDSWSSWTSTSSASVSFYSTDSYTYKSKINVLCYVNGLGVISNKILSTGIPLPEGVNLNNNISIFTANGKYYLTCSSNKGNYFYNYRAGSGGQMRCNSSSGSMTYFDYYTYNSTSKSFDFNANANIFYPGNVNFLYSYNKVRIYSDGTNTDYNYGVGEFFDFYNQEEYISPYIADTDEVLANIDDYEYTLIFPGSLSKNSLPIKFYISKYIDEAQAEAVFEIQLDTLSPYYKTAENDSSEYWFEVPTSLFKNYLVTDNDYLFVLLGANEYNEYSIARKITYKGATYVPPTDEEIQTDAIINQTQKIEEQTNAINNQTEKIEEQTEVQKSIFARIGEILSYINPLSENFFAYKLIDLLIDALKSLFVPEDGFFNNWISDINDYFSSRFGMVYSSIDFVVDFLTRLADISSNLNTDYTIHIPEFKLFDTTLIPEYSYNLADLLENETFKNIHTIYLCIIDVIMFLWLLVFARNSFAEIFGGRFIDDVFGVVESDSVSYRKYERHQENKTRYTREQNLKRYKNK